MSVSKAKWIPLEVLLAAQAGDKAAIAAVCNESNGLVQWWARKLSGGDEQRYDDMVSDGHLSIFSALRRFDPSKSKWPHYISIWLKAVMICEFGRVRKSLHRDEDIDEHALSLETDDDPLDEQFEQSHRSVLLRQTIARLPAKQRKVMELRLEGLTLREVAMKLGRGSREGLRQLELRALWRIRKLLRVEVTTPIELKAPGVKSRAHGTEITFKTGCRCAECSAWMAGVLAERQARPNHKRVYQYSKVA